MENTGIIRQGKPADKESVARLMIQAMEDLAAKLVNDADPYAALPVFSHFYEQEDTAYSFHNTLVYEDENGIGGSATAYDGAQVLELRAPQLCYLQQHYGFNKNPEPETSAGEYYLDTVSVSADRQGHGIGKKLILAIVERAKELGHARVGLLVDEANPAAKRLYLRLGFKVMDTKMLMGGVYEHMVLDV